MTVTGKVRKLETREAAGEILGLQDVAATRSTPDTPPGVGQEPTPG
jgi:hypothetical protein